MISLSFEKKKVTLLPVALGVLDLRIEPLFTDSVNLPWTALVLVPVGPAVFTILWPPVTVPLFLSIRMMMGLDVTNLISLLQKGWLPRILQNPLVRVGDRRTCPRVMT